LVVRVRWIGRSCMRTLCELFLAVLRSRDG
jgi:hypothetical protein